MESYWVKRPTLQGCQPIEAGQEELRFGPGVGVSEPETDHLWFLLVSESTPRTQDICIRDPSHAMVVALIVPRLLATVHCLFVVLYSKCPQSPVPRSVSHRHSPQTTNKPQQSPRRHKQKRNICTAAPSTSSS